MAPTYNKENHTQSINSSDFDSGFALYSQTKNPLGSLSQSDLDFQLRLANLDKRLNMYESIDENINISKNTNFCVGVGGCEVKEGAENDERAYREYLMEKGLIGIIEKKKTGPGVRQ